MRNWTQYVNTEHNVTYKWVSSDTNEEMGFSISKDWKTVTVWNMRFVIKEECTWDEQQAEKDDWLKHSCKYGHWQYDCLIALEPDDLEFIRKKLYEVCNKRRE